MNVPTLMYFANIVKWRLTDFGTRLKRFENPHTYYVDLSEKLWNLKHTMLEEYQRLTEVKKIMDTEIISIQMITKLPRLAKY